MYRRFLTRYDERPWQPHHISTLRIAAKPGTNLHVASRRMVRFIAGVQSLLGLYLLAIWVLTYFGRPFQ
jgi:hypothetical protein